MPLRERLFGVGRNGRGVLGWDNRQVDLDGRAGSLGAVHKNGSTVGCDDAMHDGEAHAAPCAKILRGKEGIEDALLNVRRHPFPRVLDHQPRVGAGLQARLGADSQLCNLDFLQRDGESPARFLHGV